APVVDDAEMPSWWREPGATWMRMDDVVKVDLHRTLAGVGVDPDRLWQALSSHVETIVIAGHRANTLTVPARAFHLALHAAQHGTEWSRPMSDLQQGLSTADEADWKTAAELAAALQATPAFAAGLRLVPEGRRLADRLGLPEEVPTDVALRASTPPPVALGLDQLARAGSLRARLAILRHKLIPPAGFMRHWSPLARRGRLGLALAYLWRPLWLLARLPAGFSAWRRARR
ncbi:MAG: nucleotidyltransferase family protein, partial [Solirubrobacterales bacterium]